MTVLGTICTNKTYVLPMITFKGEKFYTKQEANNPHKALYVLFGKLWYTLAIIYRLNYTRMGHSANGWIDSDFVYDWFVQFKECT